jgi:hypothetical protein
MVDLNELREVAGIENLVTGLFTFFSCRIFRFESHYGTVRLKRGAHGSVSCADVTNDFVSRLKGREYLLDCKNPCVVPPASLCGVNRLECPFLHARNCISNINSLLPQATYSVDMTKHAIPDGAM